MLLATDQARSLARCTLHVVPTRTLPQGVAAAFAFDPALRAPELAERMARAVAQLRTVEVTAAAASRVADGVAVEAGQGIAVVDGKLVAACGSLEDALFAGIAAAGGPEAGLITVYVGEGGNAAAAEVEVIAGGQPLYPYIVAVEP
ncbi:MAG: hypothetical protein C4321_07810 [Chloroflexota bacterium]